MTLTHSGFRAAAPTTATEARFRWRDVPVSLTVVGGPPDLADRGRRRLERLAVLWDFTRRESDLARVDAQPGVVTEVSPETATLVWLAVRAWGETGGLFDPVPREVAAGTWGAVTARARGPRPGDAAGYRDVVADARHGHVGIPIGYRFAPGPFARAVAADLVVEGLVADGAEAVRLRTAAEVRTADAAVATRRHQAGRRASPSSPAEVTVAAGRASRAAALASAALAAPGVAEATALLRTVGAPAVVVDAGGRAVVTPGWTDTLPAARL